MTWPKADLDLPVLDLDPFHPDENAVSEYNHQTHHRKVQENPHYVCRQICLFTILWRAEVR